MVHNQSASLKILALNCQSIRNKATEIEHYMHKENIDIALYSETWLTNNHKLYFRDYTTYTQDRKDREHGGVAIAIKNTIKHTLNPHCNTHSIENIGITIFSPTNEEIHISSCYFPGSTNANTLNLFRLDLAKLTSNTPSNSYFLIGDFNAKHRLWNNFRANPAGKILYEEMSRRPFVIHHPPTPTYYPPQRRATHPSTLQTTYTIQLTFIQMTHSLQTTIL